MSTAPQPKLPRGLREQSQNSHRVAARAIWQAQGAESVRKQSQNEHPATVKRRLQKRQNLAGHFVRACAVEMPGHLTRELLYENLQWKSRWPQSIPWSNPGPLATTVRTPQYGHTVWGTIVPFPFRSVNIQLFQDPVRHDATLSIQLQKKERDMTDIRNASYIRNVDIILPLEHGPCTQEDQAKNSHSHRPITGQECSQRGIQWICKFTGVNRVAHLKAAPATHPNHNVAYRACACAEEGCQRSMQVCGISKEHCHPPTPSSTWPYWRWFRCKGKLPT